MLKVFLYFLASTAVAKENSPAVDVVANRPGGSLCKDNSQCYSRLCYLEGYCAPDGPIEGTTAGGSVCTVHSDCFSGYCLEGICAPDSNVKGKIAAGGGCLQDDQCHSGYCNLRRCGPDADVVGKLAAGAECEYNSQCFSGVCHCIPGYCESKRCAADGEAEAKGPSGGYCGDDGRGCSSGACHNHRCAPESLLEPGKVANGGSCGNDSHCEESSRCYLQMCTPKEPQKFGQAHKKHPYGKPLHTLPEASKKIAPGGLCEKASDCETRLCVFGRCVPFGRFDTSKVADGGTCDERILDGQCHSGYCWQHICTTSYGGQASIGASAAGSPCNGHTMCYSGLCFHFICSSDSPAPHPTINPNSPHRHRNQVAAGGVCLEHDDCYSGHCDDGRCGPDGPTPGTLASGAACQTGDQCYSHYCYKNRCIASAGVGQQGRVAAGAPCAHSDTCAVGSSCVDAHCRLEKIIHGQHMWDFSRPVLGSVGLNGTCWHSAQCAVGKCLKRRCTVRWIPEKYTSGGEQRQRCSFKLVVTAFLSIVLKVSLS